MAKGKAKATARVEFKVVDKDGNVKYTGSSEGPIVDKREDKKGDN